MKNDIGKRLFWVVIVVGLIFYAGCASVPNEVVTLSYTVGQDLNALHVSYVQLVKTHFDGLRKQVKDFIDNRWTPIYLNNFIEKTQLSDKIKAFEPEQVLAYLQKWVQVAMNQIQKKKTQLLGPIDADEKKLMADVNDAFGRVIYANAVITANLSSIRKVKEFEDKALSALHLKEFRDKMTTFMADSSKKVQEAIDALDESGKIIDRLDQDKKDLIDKAKELLGKEKK